jgi:hypothetical protein
MVNSKMYGMKQLGLDFGHFLGGRIRTPADVTSVKLLQLSVNLTEVQDCSSV